MVRVVGSECQAVVPYDCGLCAGGAIFGEMIVDGRLHWSVTHSCPAGDRSGHSEECGRDEPPEGLRDALLEQCGEYRLRLAGDANRTVVMRVLRERRGTPLAEISELAGVLDAAGLGGTEMELRLLAEQFGQAGVSTLVQLPG
jgi:hypothetical protein